MLTAAGERIASGAAAGRVFMGAPFLDIGAFSAADAANIQVWMSNQLGASVPVNIQAESPVNIEAAGVSGGAYIH
jgi:hypothetical protein